MKDRFLLVCIVLLLSCEQDNNTNASNAMNKANNIPAIVGTEEDEKCIIDALNDKNEYRVFHISNDSTQNVFDAEFLKIRGLFNFGIELVVYKKNGKFKWPSNANSLIPVINKDFLLDQSSVAFLYNALCAIYTRPKRTVPDKKWVVNGNMWLLNIHDGYYSEYIKIKVNSSKQIIDMQYVESHEKVRL